MYGDAKERLFYVRHVFFSTYLLKKKRREKEHMLIASSLSVILVLSFCCGTIFSSYSRFSHHSVTEYETNTATKEIKVSKTSLVFFGMEMEWLCLFEFLSFAAKNSRVKADKTALRLSHLPKCGRKHKSRINCFSQNRKTFMVLFGPGTKPKGRWDFSL